MEFKSYMDCAEIPCFYAVALYFMLTDKNSFRGISASEFKFQ